MRIREIYLHNFRSFRGPNRISFVNPVTEQVHPVSVIAGPNGSGKSTILEAIASVLEHIEHQIAPQTNGAHFIHPKTEQFIQDLLETGLVCLKVEFQSEELDEPIHLALAVGQGKHLPADYEEMGPLLLRDLVYESEQDAGQKESRKRTGPKINTHTLFGSNLNPPQNGFLLLPHDRQLSSTQRGTIEPPVESGHWISRFENSNAWQGSLQQFWVWQNYLDLEKGTQTKSELGSFVESVEAVLGEKRKIRVEQGEVTIPVGWANGEGHNHRISLDQLPSGEQQVLLLFGELARQRRADAIIGIDEIENSLHPIMQRLVMANLRELARKWGSQVIVTTHSQDVLNCVRGSAAILLGNIQQPTELNGHLSDELQGTLQ